MMPSLPTAFLEKPVAHRALHDLALKRPENSLNAIRAAVQAGYGIEIDVQMSKDGEALVFHDYVLDRLTGECGRVRDRTAAELARIPLLGEGGSIPTLRDVLADVAGAVPLLIEIKDQDGALGPDVGPLETAVASALDGYSGDVAVMSFNPHSMASMAELAPGVPRGLVTDPFQEAEWPVALVRLLALRDIPDFDRVGASFISHNAKFLRMPAVSRLKARGVPVLCWTIRSAKAEAKARAVADNVTFEGYLPG